MNSRKVKPDTIPNIAYQLLCQKRINALTVKNIASTGKFSTYPIYYKFSTIEGLQRQTMDLLVSRLNNSLPVIIDKDLRNVGRAIFDFIKDKPGLIQSFFADRAFYAAFNKKVLAISAGIPAIQAELQYNLDIIFS